MRTTSVIGLTISVTILVVACVIGGYVKYNSSLSTAYTSGYSQGAYSLMAEQTKSGNIYFLAQDPKNTSVLIPQSKSLGVLCEVLARSQSGGQTK